MANAHIRTRNGKYSVVVELERDPITGKRKQKYIGTYTSITKAKKILAKVKNDCYNDTFIAPEKTLFKDYLTIWIDNHSMNLEATTLYGYKHIIDHHIIPTIGHIELQKLNPLHIQKYYNLKSKSLSGKTLLQHHRIMRKAMDSAYKMQIVSKNIFDFVDAPKAKKYKASVLTIEQGKQLIYAVKNTRFEIPVNLAIGLGLRRGEVLGLRWSDVDFENNLISITNTLTIAGKKKVFKDPKNDGSDRVIPAPSALIRLLRFHKKKQLELQIRSGGAFKNSKDLVNTNPDGKEVNPASFSNAFGHFIEKNKLPKVRFHDLRHTNATIMLTNGTQSKVASERLGHSNISTTMDLYSHVLKDVNMEAAEKINSALYE